MSDCRILGQYANTTDFRSLACANCLFFIYFVSPPFNKFYKTSVCPDGLLICGIDEEICDCANPHQVYNIPEFARNSSAVTSLDRLTVDPPLPPAYYLLTKQCCESAWNCCENTLKKSRKTSECPGTWDGWQCFDDAKVGRIQKSCPHYIYGDTQRVGVEDGRAAFKECTANGWAIHPATEQEWTDYAGCLAVEKDVQIKLFAGIVSFSISVLSIIPALAILSTFRSLRTQSVFVIHKHLLLSFLLSGFSYLFNVFFFIVDGAPGDLLHMSNHMSCRLLFAVQLRFFRLSTFSWMLAEGVYLFRLLRNSFSDEDSLTVYKIFCWGIPFVLTVLYGILREAFDNEGCWISPSVHSYIEWTVIAPCLIAICTNLLLVTVILYILVKKLRYNPHLEPMQYRKAVRAALMLVPVFGLHFLFTIYRVNSQAHQIVNLVLDGLQGFAVAIIVCYANKGVMECVRKWFGGIKESRLLRAEHKAALKRCESARSGHKKSLVEPNVNSNESTPAPTNNQRDSTTPLVSSL